VIDPNVIFFVDDYAKRLYELQEPVWQKEIRILQYCTRKELRNKPSCEEEELLSDRVGWTNANAASANAISQRNTRTEKTRKRKGNRIIITG
jgi:hypothetical protein